MLYLNLDLLENVNEYLYPLFYYKGNNCREVYFPVTKKSIYYNYNYNYKYNYTKYYDYLNNTWTLPVKNSSYIYKLVAIYKFTENNIYWKDIEICKKSNPFRIPKKDLNYLKSLNRLNKNYFKK